MRRSTLPNSYARTPYPHTPPLSTVILSVIDSDAPAVFSPFPVPGPSYSQFRGPTASSRKQSRIPHSHKTALFNFALPISIEQLIRPIHCPNPFGAGHHSSFAILQHAHPLFHTRRFSGLYPIDIRRSIILIASLFDRISLYPEILHRSDIHMVTEHISSNRAARQICGTFPSTNIHAHPLSAHVAQSNLYRHHLSTAMLSFTLSDRSESTI
jgi:hypothetical protein